MNKNKVFSISTIILILIGSIIATSLFFNRTVTVDEALAQARAYKPESGCIQVLTPATHTQTGATYLFETGCLAPGWVAD